MSRTGIGTAAAAAATALGCTLFQPALVLNQGTAGGYPVDLEPFDLVVGERWFNGNALFQSRYGKDSYLDLAALEGESKESEFTGDRPFFHPCDREAVRWLDSWGTAYTRGRVVLGTIASADRWNDCPDTIRDQEANTGALCEEMETAGSRGYRRKDGNSLCRPTGDLQQQPHQAPLRPRKPPGRCRSG